MTRLRTFVTSAWNLWVVFCSVVILGSRFTGGGLTRTTACQGRPARMPICADSQQEEAHPFMQPWTASAACLPAACWVPQEALQASSMQSETQRLYAAQGVPETQALSSSQHCCAAQASHSGFAPPVYWPSQRGSPLPVSIFFSTFVTLPPFMVTVSVTGFASTTAVHS